MEKIPDAPLVPTGTEIRGGRLIASKCRSWSQNIARRAVAAQLPPSQAIEPSAVAGSYGDTAPW